jgi:hypothetical protein
MSRVLPHPGPLIVWTALAVSVVVVSWSLPIDDFWLTIASGRAIAGGANAGVALPFSWTQEVPGALNPQWGAQLLLGAHGSLAIALAINAALLAAGVGLTVIRAARRAGGMAVAIALLLTFTALAPHLLARAQSFSIALFPLALLVLERFSGRTWLPIGYGLLIVAWANFHGAFVIGQLAAVVRLDAAVLRREPLGVPLSTALLGGVAPLFNPAGPALLAYAYGQPAAEVVTAISIEWQPSWPWIAVATPFWAILVALATGRALRRFGTPVTDLLMLAVLAALAISAVRHIPWFLLAAIPLLAADVDALLSRAPVVRRALGEMPDRLSGRRLRATLAVLAVVILAFQGARPWLPDAAGRLTPDEPAAAVDQLAQRIQPGARILNEQVWGGYLAYRLWPQVQTAMDGRLEIRSRDEWAAYFALMQGRGDPATTLDALGVRWALIGVERSALREALEMAGWIVVDDGYGILLRAAAPPG